MESLEQLEKLFDSKLENIHDKLDYIKEQTTRTNGSVDSLRAWKEKREPMLENIYQERHIKSSKTTDLIWDLVKMGVVAIISAITMLVGLT